MIRALDVLLRQSDLRVCNVPNKNNFFTFDSATCDFHLTCGIYPFRFSFDLCLFWCLNCDTVRDRKE